MTMEENKMLNDEELEKVSGGIAYDDPSQIVFRYPLGMHEEICDDITFGYCSTHSATLTKRGYTDIGCIANVCRGPLGKYFPVYYFSGDSDVEGWYYEDYISNISTVNYADNHRAPDCYVTVVDQI